MDELLLRTHLKIWLFIIIFEYFFMAFFFGTPWKACSNPTCRLHDSEIVNLEVRDEWPSTQCLLYLRRTLENWEKVCIFSDKDWKPFLILAFIRLNSCLVWNFLSSEANHKVVVFPLMQAGESCLSLY